MTLNELEEIVVFFEQKAGRSLIKEGGGVVYDSEILDHEKKPYLVSRLWEDCNKIIQELKNNFPEFFKLFYPVRQPEPSILYFIGSKISKIGYKRGDFQNLLEVIKDLKDTSERIKAPN